MPILPVKLLAKTVLLLGAILSLLLTTSRAQSPHYDLLIKGGHVIDPANHMDAVMDVAVAGGKIAISRATKAPSFWNL